jgi:integrase
MAKFTTKFVENVKPGPGRREIPDPGCSNLYLLVQSSGHRSWAVRYRFGGKSIKLTLGQWPALTLLDARKAAIDAQRELGKGHDPAKAKADSKIKADAAKADTLTSVCEMYLGRPDTKTLRTIDQRKSILKRQIYPVLGSRPIGEIRRSEIVHLLDKVEDNSGSRAADVCLGVLRAIFHWHEKRSDEFRSPIVRGMARQNTVEHRRTRILSDDEIRAVWAATADGQPFSALIRLALLTSARRNEIAGMRWDEIDDDGIWALPPSRSKTKVEVVRPLSKMALAVLARLPRIDGCDFIFTSNGITPINSFSDPKRLLDKRSGVTGWTVHDTRRTARSLMSRAGVPVDHAERVLGHSRGDIRERYDRHRYIAEMTHAVEMLSAEITRIINPPEGEVIPMRRR